MLDYVQKQTFAYSILFITHLRGVQTYRYTILFIALKVQIYFKLAITFVT